MSERHGLRDARLQRALEHAPDADMQPAAAVRQAILAAAHEAADGVARATVRPAVPAAAVARPGASWWARWKGAGGGHMPWNAAFATVLVAGFVTLLWQRQEVPDARLDTAASSADKPVPAAVPTPPPAAEQEEPRAEFANRNEGRERGHERERELREDRVARKAAVKKEPADGAPPVVAQMQAAPAAHDAPAAPMAKAAPTVPAAPAAEADAVAPPPAPSVAAAPAPAPLGELRARAAAPAALRAPAARLPAWTALRVVEGASVLPVARGDAGRLPSLLQLLASPAAGPGQAAQSSATPATESASGTFASAPPLRLELMQGSDMLGLLEITGTQWRFTPAAGSSVQTGRANEQTLQALRAELQRLGLLP